MGESVHGWHWKWKVAASAVVPNKLIPLQLQQSAEYFFKQS